MMNSGTNRPATCMVQAELLVDLEPQKFAHCERLYDPSAPPAQVELARLALPVATRETSRRPATRENRPACLSSAWWPSTLADLSGCQTNCHRPIWLLHQRKAANVTDRSG